MKNIWDIIIFCLICMAYLVGYKDKTLSDISQQHLNVTDTVFLRSTDGVEWGVIIKCPNFYDSRINEYYRMNLYMMLQEIFLDWSYEEIYKHSLTSKIFVLPDRK